MSRSAAASTGPDIVGLGPVGVSVTGLDSAWRASLALAIGPLAASGAPAAFGLEAESWSAARDATSGTQIGTQLVLDAAPTDAALAVDDERSGVRARLIGGGVRLASRSGAAGNSGRVLPFCLGPPLLDAGAALLHAATIGLGGRSVLVIGPTGAGKSTAVAAARAAGLATAGDDLAVVWDDARWRVQGLARPVRVPPELAPEAEAIVGDLRSRVSPQGWASGGTSELIGVALVGHGTEGRLAPADPVAVARSVLGAAFATALPSGVAPSLRMARRLAALPGWHLELAADPADRLAAAGRDLRSLVT